MMKQMQNSLVRPVFVVAVLVSLGLWAADATLGPMSGVGGVMRDAERRALPLPPVSHDGKVPEAAPSGADSVAVAADTRVVGKIKAVRAVGDVEFAEQKEVDIPGRLLAVLSGEQERTVDEIRTAIANVRKELMNEGFYLLRITLPRRQAYDRESGSLVVQVDRGRFGHQSIAFEDERDEGRWFSREQIAYRFRKIVENDTFDYARLRGVLAEVNAHPDLTVDTSIDIRKPIEGEGENRKITRYADFGFTVHESFPLHGIWEFNNYGMEEIEEWQTSLTLQYLNLTKHDDVVTLSPSMSLNGELASLAASYMLPHRWWRGGNTTLYGGYSYLDTEDVVPQLDLEGSGWFVGLMHSESIIDDDDCLLAASLGLMARYLDDQYSVLGHKLNERSVTVFPLSAALSYTGRKNDFIGGRNFATLQAIYNTDVSGDKLGDMWTGADEHYWILRGQFAHLQPLFGLSDEAHPGRDLHQWTLFSKIEGQYTDDTLVPTEKLSLGGFNTVRGYHTRGYLGDWGFYGTEELRTPILVDGFASLFGDRTGKTPFDRLQLVAFMDYGYTRYNDLPSGYDEDEWLWSAGFGFRAAVTKYCTARCDVAFPLHDGNNDDDDDVEVYLSIQFQF